VSDLVACVDFGSTYTKALLVDISAGEVVATAEAPTTSRTDVIEGWLACRDLLSSAHRGARRAPALACSSAGGGLRISVVGNEALVTAEAGRRVALSSGGRVVHVGADGLSGDGLAALASSHPDVVLLVGGTDDGNAEVLLAAARRLASTSWRTPVVVAGNATAAPEAGATLSAAGVDVEVVANVVPRIGVLHPEPARAAIRAMFLRHVIGGTRLSAAREFRDMVVGPTPDVVLTAVELLSVEAGDVAVVDVGGATTDVYSVVRVNPEERGLARQVVAATTANRTVEGDLGMRWSIRTTLAAAQDAGLMDAAEAAELADAAHHRAEHVAHRPVDATDAALDLRFADLAVGVALRRHAGRARVVVGPDGRLIERSGTDLREIDLLVGSGGVLRHAVRSDVERALRRSVGEVDGGWLLPRAPRLAIDSSYVLAAAGLLAGHHAAAAGVLLRRYVADQAAV